MVSHEGTRYSDAQGPGGLAAQLASALSERGVSCSVVVDTANRLNTTREPVTHRDVQESLSAQLDMENTWARYLRDSRSPGLLAALRVGARWIRRTSQRLAPPPPAMVERLLNIEFAHRELLRQGLESEASWIVILEDDASTDNVVDLAEGLGKLLAHADSRVEFINLSESFAISELGIDHILRNSNALWHGTVKRAVDAATRPVTNTVCAIAYRSTFAQRLLEVYSAMPLRPVVPIDWKLNKALMQMHDNGELGSGSCLWVIPGPIDQGSMRSVS